jgi:hypothetical protein
MRTTAPRAKRFAVTSGWWVGYRQSHFSGGIQSPRRNCSLWIVNWNYSLGGHKANYFRLPRHPGIAFTEPTVDCWIPRYVREGNCGPPHGRGSPPLLRQRQKNSEAVAVVGRVVQLIIGKSNVVEFQIGAVTRAILPGQIHGER